MALVVIVDTTVFLNFLDVPAFNQDRDKVLKRFEELIRKQANFLLPMAAIFEAGNHIAQLSDGGQRRRYAEIFVTQVTKALDGDAPWRPIQMPDIGRVRDWLAGFPDFAMRGAGTGDLSIVRQWEEACRRHPTMRVLIWALDGHLDGYDRDP